MAINRNKIIRNWLLELKAMCRPELGMDVAAEQIAIYVEALRTLDPKMFTTDSRDAIAEKSEFFPSYKALRDSLTQWWCDHQPAPLPRLIGPGGVHLTVVDEHWVKYWQRRVTEDDCQSWGKRRHLLHLIRERSMNAYGYLCQTDELAARIGVASGWIQGSTAVETDAELRARMQAQWGDRDVVSACVQKALAAGGDPTSRQVTRAMALLRALVACWAPGNLDLVPGGGVVVQ